jgi:hypothetical protein
MSAFVSVHARDNPHRSLIGVPVFRAIRVPWKDWPSERRGEERRGRGERGLVERRGRGEERRGRGERGLLEREGTGAVLRAIDRHRFGITSISILRKSFMVTSCLVSGFRRFRASHSYSPLASKHWYSGLGPSDVRKTTTSVSSVMSFRCTGSSQTNMWPLLRYTD